MSFKEIANSGIVWATTIVGIIIVVIMILFYLKLCYKKALEMGVDKQTMKAVVKSSITFSIIPSIAVVAGLVTLAVVIGLPYGWFRLSVIGSVSYELMSANMALSALQLDLETADAYAFSLMAWSMCLGMTLSIIFNLFFNKKIHMGTLKLGKGDKKWEAISQNVFMLALMCALLVPMVFAGGANLLTFITSAVIAVLVSILAKALKAKWLNDFILVISMIGAMASSVLWDKLF